MKAVSVVESNTHTYFFVEYMYATSFSYQKCVDVP